MWKLKVLKVKEAIKKVLMKNSKSESESNLLLSDIESDIRTILKTCGSLIYELNESQKRYESDTKKMLLDYIGVVDAFERVFKNIEPKLEFADEQTKIWINNFRSVYRQLLRALKSAGVTPIETIIGEKVNPYWHNVEEVVEFPGRENETIVEEIVKGYLWKGKLLRTSSVKVVKND